MVDGVVLRDDLVVTRIHEDGDFYYQVEDPDTSATYEFGEQEWFLLQGIDGESNPEKLIEAFSARYKAELSLDEFASFIEMVTDWGLVTSKIALDSTENETLSYERDVNADSIYDDLIEVPALDASSILESDKPFRSRASQLDRKKPEVSDVNWVLFNPDSLFLKLSSLLSPLKWLRYLVPLLVIVACLILFNNVQAFTHDFSRFRSPISIIYILIFSMFTLNLFAQIGRGVVLRGFAVPVEQFGIKMVAGVLPRFAINAGSLEHLSRSKKLVAYSSPLLIRLVFFSMATMLWLMSRPTNTALPAFSLMLLVVATVSTIMAANPLLKSEGYDTLTTLLDMPNLKQKANLALFGGKENPLADRVLAEDNAFALRAYALSSMIFIISVIGAVLILSARWFELNYQGTGVAVYLLLTTYLTWRFYSRFVTKRAEMKDRRSKVEAALAARNNSGQTDNVNQRPGRRKRSRKKSGWGWDVPESLMLRIPERIRAHIPERVTKRHIFLMIFLIVLCLPYPYETGGVLKVLPDKQYEIYAETHGVIKEIMNKGGEYLKSGTVLATLSSLEQEKNLLTTQSSILEHQAKLEQLQSTPTEEDVKVARSRLGTTRTQYKYSSESYKRVETLYKDGNVSLDDYKDEQKQMAVDSRQVEEAQANLDKVLAGPHPKEIEAAVHELSRLQEKLKFDQEEIERTNLVMPIDGYIVTLNLDHMVGLYLDEGDYFATAENDEYVRLEIKIPESDIADVVPGADVRFKVWAYGDQLFYGKVSEIARVALEEDYGEVVAVIIVILNTDQLLKSGMTGFGKVDGGSKIVFVAFTRMLARFFTIEMWSWFP